MPKHGEGGGDKVRTALWHGEVLEAVGDAARTAHLCGLLGACHPADIACNCWEQVGDKLQMQPGSGTGWFRALHSLFMVFLIISSPFLTAEVIRKHALENFLP